MQLMLQREQNHPHHKLLYGVKSSLHQLTIDLRNISMKFSLVSYEHLKGLLLVHSATTLFANLRFLLVKDNARGENAHTYIKKIKKLKFTLNINALSTSMRQFHLIIQCQGQKQPYLHDITIKICQNTSINNIIVLTSV